MKVVLDTNVLLVSISRKSPYYPIYKSLLRGDFQCCVTVKADPDDDKFVDCAVAGNVDYIVSDDRHFNVLKKLPFPKLRVISADDFLSLVVE